MTRTNELPGLALRSSKAVCTPVNESAMRLSKSSACTENRKHLPGDRTRHAPLLHCQDTRSSGGFNSLTKADLLPPLSCTLKLAEGTATKHSGSYKTLRLGCDVRHNMTLETTSHTHCSHHVGKISRKGKRECWSALFQTAPSGSDLQRRVNHGLLLLRIAPGTSTVSSTAFNDWNNLMGKEVKKAYRRTLHVEGSQQRVARCSFAPSA